MNKQRKIFRFSLWGLLLWLPIFFSMQGCTTSRWIKTNDTTLTRKQEPYVWDYKIKVIENAGLKEPKTTFQVFEIPFFETERREIEKEIKQVYSEKSAQISILSGLLGFALLTSDTLDFKGRTDIATLSFIVSLGSLIAFAIPEEESTNNTRAGKVTGPGPSEEGEPQQLSRIVEAKVICPRTGKTAEKQVVDGRFSVDMVSELGIKEVSPGQKSTYGYQVLIDELGIQQDFSVNAQDFLALYGRVKKQIDNIRARPTVQSKIVRKCKYGETYRVLNTRGNWNKIELGNQIAWVHNSVVDKYWAPLYRLDPANPPHLESQVVFTEPSGNNMLDAEETAQVKVTVKNVGRGNAYNVTAVLEPQIPTSHMTFARTHTLGVIPPGEEKTMDVEIRADYQIPSRDNLIRISFTEANGFPPSPLDLRFKSLEEQPPNLIIANVGIDDDKTRPSFGNNNGKIELGETIEVGFRVYNQGTGKAENVVANVRSEIANITLGPNTRFDLGILKPGEYRNVSFHFNINTLYDGPIKPPIHVHLQERRERFAKTNLTLDLEIDKYIPPITIVDVKPETTKPDELPSVPELSVDVDDPPKTGISNPNAVAVVIGVSRYQNTEVPTVNFAVRDAETMKDYLEHGFGYNPNRIIYKTNDEATKGAFETIFNPGGMLSRYLDPQGQSDVFVYYSGHGAPDIDTGEQYFIPHDCDPQFARHGGYSLNEFYDNLGKIQARSVTVVIDACFSGLSEGGQPLIRDISLIQIKSRIPIFTLRNGTVFASSAENQVSSWYRDKKHGLFTYFFLKGLQGEADTDGDRQITVQELGDYVRTNVRDMALQLYKGRVQEPQIIGNPDRVLFSY